MRGRHAKSTDVADDVQENHECERERHGNGKKVRHYHADDGDFASKDCKDEVHKDTQTIIHCEVGPHFQKIESRSHVASLEPH